MRFKPAGNKILVERHEESEVRSPGGLILPASTREPLNQGDVVAVGKGVLKADGTREPVDVEVGDVVLFGPYAGTEISVEGAKYLLMSASDVFGFIAPNQSIEPANGHQASEACITDEAIA